ncbi:MAG: SDR family oxidoreductase [Chitinophagaceae bacterium]|nr:SDR family oxidoreductase [Chitinophagaceae bacterium]
MTTKSKVALVTGASRGLGKNAALRLAERGTDVIITYNKQSTAADAVVEEIVKVGRRAFALQLNVEDAGSFGGFAERLSEGLAKWELVQIDYLVNNAGIDAVSMIPDTTEAAFDSLFNVHFKGVYFLTQRLLPLLAQNGGIVNLSTGLTRFSTPGYAAYASMKGAVEVLTRYLAKELGSRGINVNTVAPGIVETDFTKEAFDAHPGLNSFMSGITALGRVGQPQDIGGVIAFLCSDDARWINAQRIEVSGGMFL